MDAGRWLVWHLSCHRRLPPGAALRVAFSGSRSLGLDCNDAMNDAQISKKPTDHCMD